jgi:hypothetical protein
MASFMLSHFSYVLFLQLLSLGGEDVYTLLVEVTRVWETSIAVEAARVTEMLTAETSAWDFVAAWDSATLRVKDVEDRAALAKREALERVLRAEVEHATALASAHEDADGLVRKITLLENELVA